MLIIFLTSNIILMSTGSVRPRNSALPVCGLRCNRMALGDTENGLEGRSWSGNDTVLEFLGIVELKEQIQ